MKDSSRAVVRGGVPQLLEDKSDCLIADAMSVVKLTDLPEDSFD